MSEENEKRESVADIVADIRERAYNATRHGERTTDNYAVSELLESIADRIETAWKREREASEDETLVKSCNTCKHFTCKRKWCRVHDYSPHDPSKLPLIWPNGPCPQWECKYNSHGGVEK